MTQILSGFTVIVSNSTPGFSSASGIGVEGKMENCVHFIGFPNALLQRHIRIAPMETDTGPIQMGNYLIQQQIHLHFFGAVASDTHVGTLIGRT